MIENRGGAKPYVVLNAAGTRVLGRHKTRAGANYQLRAIEASKAMRRRGRMRHDALNHQAVHTAGLLRSHRRAGIVHKRTRMPRQIPPRMIEQEYTAALLKIVAVMRHAFAPFLEAVSMLVPAPTIRQDAGEADRARRLVAAARQRMTDAITTDDLERLAKKFFDRTSTYQRLQLGNQVRAALGTDVFLADRRLRPLANAFVDANVGLIKDIGDQLATNIESVTLGAIESGMLHGDLATELEGRFGFAESRAALIARDQIGKAYGQINASRQGELGITHFTWRTMNDERVRAEHDALEGETFAYANPPDEGLPGEPVNCRCYAEPVLDEIITEADIGAPHAVFLNKL